MCTITEFNNTLTFNGNDLESHVPDDGDIEPKLNTAVSFYPNLDYSSDAYVFNQVNFEHRAGEMLSQSSRRINMHWVLLDSESTVDLFCNPELLIDIRTMDEELKIYCNAGVTTTNHIGDLLGYGTLWFHTEAISNILSLFLLLRNTMLSLTSGVGNFVLCEEPKGHQDDSVQDHAVYTIVTSHKSMAQYSPLLMYLTSIHIVIGISLPNDGIIEIVVNNMKNYTYQQIKDAVRVREFQDSLGLITTSILGVVNTKMMQTPPIKMQPIKDAIDIYGPRKVHIQGKTVRLRSDSVKLDNDIITPIPPHIINQHKNVIMGMDIVNVITILFIVTRSCVIKLNTAT